jgi:hypothetical protein
MEEGTYLSSSFSFPTPHQLLVVVMLVHSAHPHSRCPLVPVRQPSLLLALVSAHPPLLPLAPLVAYGLLLVLGYALLRWLLLTRPCAPALVSVCGTCHNIFSIKLVADYTYLWVLYLINNT